MLDPGNIILKKHQYNVKNIVYMKMCCSSVVKSTELLCHYFCLRYRI